ncbi:MAG: transposase [Candidatus Omnitrophica bacterium]|nr:transposase [Candidatus Omnitrophota bacterium]
MARAARILFEGAYYHVMNRGQSKRDIYLDERDYKKFLAIIREGCRMCHVEIVAYCLMRNHYHLLVHTPEANLPQFMRQVNGVYTQYFNQKYKKDGSLFKGRYKANIVQEGSYLLRLIRYIHNNPVKAGLVRKASKYPYTSDQHFMRKEEFSWLRYMNVLNGQLKGKGNLLEKYQAYMKMADEELEEFLKAKRRKSIEAIIYGQEEFLDEVKTKYLHQERSYGEIPQAKKMKWEVVIKRIKREIQKVLGVKEEVLYQSMRGSENVARQMAIGLAREVGGVPYKEIGAIFGGISYKSAAKYCERLKQRCERDRKLSGLYEELRGRCSQVET